VPLGVSQIAEGFHLAGKFLDAIFAEDAKAAIVSFANLLRGNCLCDPD